MLSLRRMLGGLLVAGALVASAGQAVADATHKQAKTLVPMYEGQRLNLNTFCLGPDGQPVDVLQRSRRCAQRGLDYGDSTDRRVCSAA